MSLVLDVPYSRISINPVWGDIGPVLQEHHSCPTLVIFHHVIIILYKDSLYVSIESYVSLLTISCQLDELLCILVFYSTIPIYSYELGIHLYYSSYLLALLEMSTRNSNVTYHKAMSKSQRLKCGKTSLSLGWYRVDIHMKTPERWRPLSDCLISKYKLCSQDFFFPPKPGCCLCNPTECIFSC